MYNQALISYKLCTKLRKFADKVFNPRCYGFGSGYTLDDLAIQAAPLWGYLANLPVMEQHFIPYSCINRLNGVRCVLNLWLFLHQSGALG